MEELIAYLQSMEPGPIEGTDRLERLLAGCWDELEGSDWTRMMGYKVINRMESVVWKPPVLSFDIERHGAAVLGSTRAEVQHWRVDLDDKTRELQGSSRRQIRPMAPRVYVGPIAKELAQAMLNHREDERLRWNKDGTVTILTGKIFPKGSAVKQTLEGRRKRLHKAVEKILVPAGWCRVVKRYHPPATDEE